MHNASHEISHNFHDTDLATLADTATLAATLRGALFCIINLLLNSFKYTFFILALQSTITTTSQITSISGNPF